MASVDSYDSYTVKIGSGEDEKGVFEKYRRTYERPCGCHPETCCHFDEKVWDSEEYKVYVNKTAKR